MIKENFIPLGQASMEASSKLIQLAKQSQRNAAVLRDLIESGEPATSQQEAALVSELDTAEAVAAYNEAVRVFQSAVDENPWEPA